MIAAFIRMWVLIAIGALINKSTFEGGGGGAYSKGAPLIGRRALNRIIMVYSTGETLLKLEGQKNLIRFKIILRSGTFVYEANNHVMYLHLLSQKKIFRVIKLKSQSYPQEITDS